LELLLFQRTLFEIKDDPLASYENKLYIEWDGGVVKWAQKGINKKVITKLINTNELAFPGFEKVRLTYKDLKGIIDDPKTYTHCPKALSSVNAIYAIADLVNGKNYIGSSYNKDGLLGRWSNYATTLHGNNEVFKKLLKKEPTAHLHFQYSILKVLPKDVAGGEAVDIENE